MRLALFMLCAVIAATTACKLEASSNNANANANANKNADQSTASTASSNPDVQSTCSLKLAGAPAISGVRLGMTPDEVLATFPGSKDDSEVQAFLKRPPSPLGVSELFIRPSKYQPSETKAEPKVGDVTNIAITLLDGHVYTLNVSYNGPQYAHVDKFVASFLADKNLPPLEQWDPYVGMDNTLKVLNCAEFEVNVFIGGPGGNLNYVLLKDLVADKKLKDRRAKARAQQSPTPSP